MNQVTQEYTLKKQDFYTKQFSHPHPLVRIFNIIDYFRDNIKDDFPTMEIDSQELFNNVLGISNLYFDNLIPNQNAMQLFVQDIKDNIDEIYRYNQELYDFAIKDKSIKKLLKKRRIKF